MTNHLACKEVGLGFLPQNFSVRLNQVLSTRIQSKMVLPPGSDGLWKFLPTQTNFFHVCFCVNWVSAAETLSRHLGSNTLWKPSIRTWATGTAGLGAVLLSFFLAVGLDKGQGPVLSHPGWCKHQAPAPGKQSYAGGNSVSAAYFHPCAVKPHGQSCP